MKYLRQKGIIEPLSMRPFFNFVYNVRSNEEVDDEKIT